MNLERKTIRLKGCILGEAQICTTGEDRRLLTVIPFAYLANVENYENPKESFVKILKNEKVAENHEE